MRAPIAVLLGVFCLGLLPASAQRLAPPPQTLSAGDLQKLTVIAQTGDSPAQAHLGAVYALGNDVQQNYGYAYFWLTLAAINGDAEFEPIRSDVANLLTPDTVAALQNKARSWKPGTTVTITPAAGQDPAPPAPVTASDFSYFAQIKMRLKEMYFNATTNY